MHGQNVRKKIFTDYDVVKTSCFAMHVRNISFETKALASKKVRPRYGK